MPKKNTKRNSVKRKRSQVFARYGGRCVLCGRQCEQFDSSKEFYGVLVCLVKLSTGGSTDLDNL